MTEKTLGFLQSNIDSAAELASDIDEKELFDIIKVIEQVAENGGKIYTMGNGGSASTAKHLAADLDKTADEQIKLPINSTSLVSNESLITAWTNDEGWEEVFKGQIEQKIAEQDVLIGISVHGGTGEWSGNLIKALDYANEQGAKTIGITGFDGGKFTETCDQTIIVEKDSTPLVESLHVLIHHLLVFGLIEEVKNTDNSISNTG